MISPIVLLLLSSAALDAQPHQQAFRSDEASECGVVADHYFLGQDAQREIWLKSTKESGHPALLTRYVRNATVVFSPDCNLVALNDHLGSNESLVRLFQKKAGLVYTPLPADIAGKAWRTLARMFNGGHAIRLWHEYVNALAWSADSQAILLHVWGHTDVRNRVDDWFCVYDLGSGSISTDLSLMNRRSVFIEGQRR